MVNVVQSFNKFGRIIGRRLFSVWGRPEHQITGHANLPPNTILAGAVPVVSWVAAR
jgi:hypothetical protein